MQCLIGQPHLTAVSPSHTYVQARVMLAYVFLRPANCYFVSKFSRILRFSAYAFLI